MKRSLLKSLGALLMSTQIANAATDCPAVSVPAYFLKNSAADWNAFHQGASARTRTDVMILSPCRVTNPLTPCVKLGETAMPEYVEIIRKNKFFNIKSIGYIWTDNGRRPIADVKSEIDRYRNIYDVAGFFLDGADVGTDATKFKYYQDLSYYIRSGKSSYVALNPGVFPSLENYFWIADRIVTFEGTMANYARAQAPLPSWATRIPASKIWHLVHTVPNLSTSVSQALDLASKYNAGALYLTNRPGSLSTDNPWLNVPPFFQSMISMIDSRCNRK
jgi:Spherulation-specific family 4